MNSDYRAAWAVYREPIKEECIPTVQNYSGFIHYGDRIIWLIMTGNAIWWQSGLKTVTKSDDFLLLDIWQGYVGPSGYCNSLILAVCHILISLYSYFFMFLCSCVGETACQYINMSRLEQHSMVKEKRLLSPDRVMSGYRWNTGMGCHSVTQFRCCCLVPWTAGCFRTTRQSAITVASGRGVRIRVCYWKVRETGR